MQILVRPSFWDTYNERVLVNAPIEARLRLMFDSPEDMPLWLQERWAVIRLLDGGEESPLGAWEHRVGKNNFEFFYVPQPGDPVTITQQGADQ